MDLETTDSSISAVLILPSKGYLYDGKLEGGKVVARSTTAKEEKLLYGGRGHVGDKINTLLSRCLDLGGKISPNDMLVGDRLFCLIKIRMLSFGADYPVMVRCGDCGEQFRHELSLTELEVNTYEEEDNVSEPFEVTLPHLGKKVGFRCLRGFDEDAIHKYQQQLRAKSRRSNEDNTYIYTTARRIVSLDGEKLSQLDASEFVESLVSKDLMELRFAIEEKECGVNTEVRIECPHCAFLNELIMPFTDEFFRPKRRTV